MKTLLPLALAPLLLLAPPAAAQQQLLGVCQSLVGDETNCDVDTDWSVTKEATPNYLLEPMGAPVGYTVTVTEGETRYNLQIGSIVNLTGLIVDGTRVRGLVVSLQRGTQGGYTTVASARYGEFQDDCGCPFVDNGQLNVVVRDSQGNVVPAVQESIVDFLGYTEHMSLKLEVNYDLSAGIILPGDSVRVQTCINYAPINDVDALPGCFYDGGSVRTTKACTPFDFDSYVLPKITDVSLDELLGDVDDAFVSVYGFVAEAVAGAVTPVGAVSLDPDGLPATFKISPTGVSGAQSIISVTGFAECAPIVTCAEAIDGLCKTTLTNDVALSLGNDTTNASATVEIACPLFDCTEDSCNDNDPCTTDLCTPGVGCDHAPASGEPCEDGNPCTMNDVCEAGACLGGTNMVCGDDADPCTTSWCDPAAGCVTGWSAIGTACDDGNLCTTGDYCKFGGCWGGTPITCTTDNPCLEATCDPAQGCVELEIRGPCEDGDPCTLEDRCEDGACTGGVANSCDDQNPCTSDSCSSHAGCVHVAHGGECEDGDLCTDGDYCFLGQCRRGTARVCEDTPCAVASCDPAVGCVLDPVPDGQGCDDGEACQGCPWAELGVEHGYDVTAAAVMPGFTLPGDYVLWASGFFGFKAAVRWRQVEGLQLLLYPDGTGVLRGQVEVFDTGGAPATTDVIWDLEMRLAFRGVGPNGQGTGGPHRELGLTLQGISYSDLWRYYEMQSGTMHSTTSSNWAELIAYPPNGVFPFQMGDRANNRNLNFGASAWFTYRHHRGADLLVGQGDLNVDLIERFCAGPDLCVGGVCTPGPTAYMCVDLVEGDYCSYEPADWALTCAKAPDSAGCLMEKNFSQLVGSPYACSGGATWAIGFSELPRIAFTAPLRLQEFVDPRRRGWLPVYNTLYCDPVSLVTDAYVKKVVAARLNVDLSDKGLLPSPYGLAFGDLVIIGGDCDGRTVRNVVHRAEMVYAGATVDGTTCRDRASLEVVLTKINASFADCLEMTGYLGPPSP